MGAGSRRQAAECLVNGRPARALDIEDRGLLYGDGLFETIAIRQGRPCLWVEHVARLQGGAARLGIPLPAEAVLREDLRRLCNGIPAATLKLILTRGGGVRGYRPPDRPHPTRILIRYPATADGDDWPRPGIAVRLCTTRLGIQPALAGLKHLNRLEQVLARAEWCDPNVVEGLMCDAEGLLVGGTMTNLFLARDGEILTPRLDRTGVAGTVRSRLLREAADRGISLREARLRPPDLIRADGAFVTNALTGCRPIRRVADRDLDPAAVPSALLARVQRAVFAPEPL